MQLFLNIIISFSIIWLAAQSFSLIYYPLKFFHIAHAIIITLGAYFVYLFKIQLGLNDSFSIILSILLCTLFGILINVIIYEPLIKKGGSPLVLLIASLGVFVIFQNLISLTWGDNTRIIRDAIIKAGNNFAGGSLTNTQITTILISALVVLIVILILKISKFGMSLRALSSNNHLSEILGINRNKVVLYSIAIGSAIASIAGILVAYETDMTPTMGFNLLLYGVVAMIIGGVGSTWGLIWGSLLLATAQHLGAYYIDSKWMDAIAYIILILFLIWKPLGFSGKRLKKVEI